MDTKISSRIWSNPAFENAAPDAKLAALWLLTNEHVNELGYAEMSERRFIFETQLTAEALAKGFTAIGKGSVRTEKGYWLRNYIAWQCGRGAPLVKNNFSRRLTKLLMGGCSEEIGRLVLGEYPELLEVEGFVSPWQGVCAFLKHRRGEERRGEERRRSGGAGGATRAADHPEAEAMRMIAVGGIMRRRDDSLWSAAEKNSLRAAGLLALPEDDFNEQVQVMRRFYRAPSTPANPIFRRTSLLVLLNNWTGELDKARAWQRDHAPESDNAKLV